MGTNMKTKIYWITLLVGVVALTQAQAGALASGAQFRGGPAAMTHAAVGRPAKAAPVRNWGSAPHRGYYRPHAFVPNRFAGSNRVFTSRPHQIVRPNAASYLPSSWRNHVYARHSVSWHRDWDRSRIYWWNGHRCCFLNGSWIVFDEYFDPWWWWPYPNYNYYGYDYESDYIYPPEEGYQP